MIATTDAIARAILTACRTSRDAQRAHEDAALARLQAADGDEEALDRAMEMETLAEIAAELDERAQLALAGLTARQDSPANSEECPW